MDRGSYEKLSIKDNARSLKMYGSTSKFVPKNENFAKHYVSNTDTLQGIALKYNVTIEQLRRANKLWASDSLFLREFLLVPVPEGTISDSGVESTQQTPATTPGSAPQSSVQSPISNCSYDIDDDNISDFLSKIDAAIASTKEEVKKTAGNSEFVSELDPALTDGRRRPTARLRQAPATNGSEGAPAVVVQHGRKDTSGNSREKHSPLDFYRWPSKSSFPTVMWKSLRVHRRNLEIKYGRF